MVQRIPANTTCSNYITVILIILGSSEDLDMVTQGEETTIKLLLQTRSPRINYSYITSEAIMAMKRPPVMISSSDRVPEQDSR